MDPRVNKEQGLENINAGLTGLSIITLVLAVAFSGCIGGDDKSGTGTTPTDGGSGGDCIKPYIPADEGECCLDENDNGICDDTEKYYSHGSPAIYEDKIIYSGERNGNVDIYMYDISTGGETKITTSGSAQGGQAIHGDKIVWVDYRNSRSDVYLYDLSKSKETQITTENSGKAHPGVYGDIIVWSDNRNGNWDIYMYDGEVKQVTSDSSDQGFPAVHGDIIVWRDNRNRPWTDIYMYDISTPGETRVPTDNCPDDRTGANCSKQSNPAVYGDIIVWDDNRNNNSNWDIYMYDGEVKQITTAYFWQWVPAVHGSIIVYQDNRNNNSDIYMYDILTRGETRITTDVFDQTNPAVHGDIIVYENCDRKDRWGTYMCDICMYDISTGNETRIT
ncbi:MAG: hypothetical protein A7315_08835 [Candidatus Altiarchaeales archaeon WOR_SM1_79]|nr:MAG: hypothetical protein A7315_08835 [Candidatus Altiarchaeales archaeon WOR_SM1_79]